MRTGFIHWLRTAVTRPARAGARLSFTRSRVYVHPCVIDKQPHIVYPRGLALRQPELFHALQHHYRCQGYALKEDQRSATVTRAPSHERRRWAPILLFTVDLIFEGAAFADTNNPIPVAAADPNRQVVLQLASSKADAFSANELHTLPPRPSLTKPVNVAAANAIFDLLKQHYKRRDTDPDYIFDDFREIASYYSAFPEIVNMLDRLKEKNWRLIYDEHSWVTVASGNVFNVDNASVHFNTRSAAQLKMYNQCKDNPVCIASPADALLHELLHAHSMLVNTREFIAQGGMNAVMYPYKHEYAIIDAERKLYASMSRHDAIKRPQRIDHTGRLVRAQCSTCIK